jgi:hypothetical protein
MFILAISYHQTHPQAFTDSTTDRTVLSTDQARAAHPSRQSATQQHTNSAPKPTQEPSTQVYVPWTVQASPVVVGRKRVSNSSLSLVQSGACRPGKRPLVLALMPTAR